MLLLFGRVVLKYLKNIFIGCYKIFFPFPFQSSICPYQVHLGRQMGTSPSTSSYSCYFALPAPRTQTFGRRPTLPWVHLYGRCQSLGQSFMRSITPVGAPGPLFPPIVSFPVCVLILGHSFWKWTWWKLMVSPQNIPQNSQQTPNHVDYMTRLVILGRNSLILAVNF